MRTHAWQALIYVGGTPKLDLNHACGMPSHLIPTCMIFLKEKGAEEPEVMVSNDTKP